MRLSTLDLGAFGVAKIVGKRAALRFNHEVQPLPPVGIDQYSPIRVVASEGRRRREPSGKLGVHLDGGVLLKLVRKIGLNARFVDDLLVDRLSCIFEHVLQMAGQLFLLEEFLRVIVLVSQALVLDAVD